LFTVCPKCTLTLVVTTVDLRAGQGYVRCGRCANVFNALIALREGDPQGNASDSATRRILETQPSKPPAEPAFGAGLCRNPSPCRNRSLNLCLNLKSWKRRHRKSI
jgi:predicted Zn finger-like uncharacterized protein